MASGKTTFGRAAAERLGWAFLDLDEMIAQRYGTPPEIFAAHGEAFFRDVESQLLAEVLNTSHGDGKEPATRDTVLALGGGTVLYNKNLRLLKATTTLIWLDTAFELILSELYRADRPLLHGRTIAQIRELYDARRPRYAAAADLIFPIDTNDDSRVIPALAATIQRKATEGPASADPSGN